jgi:thioredoxin-related protein
MPQFALSLVSVESRFALLKRFLLLAIVLQLAPAVAQAKQPDGWPFMEFNQAVRKAKLVSKPIFVYFGFATCPYCEIANKSTFSSNTLRTLYAEHYVLAYFNIRGNPNDIIALPDGEELTRAEAIKRLKASPVPAWTFLSPEGKEILARRGSATPIAAFMQFDQYVSSRAYQQISFEDFLAQHGMHEAKPGQ